MHRWPGRELWSLESRCTNFLGKTGIRESLCTDGLEKRVGQISAGAPISWEKLGFGNHCAPMAWKRTLES